MEKYLVWIRTFGDIIEIKTEEVERITEELRPFVVDLPTMTTFLQIMGRSRGSQLYEHWQQKEFALVRRSEII